MRRAAPLLPLLALLAGLAAQPAPGALSTARTVTLDDSSRAFYLADENRTVVLDEGGQVVLDSAVDANDTLVEFEGELAPVVRRKRTFGDIVFRGLADVLGYQVARKPPQVVFPPPVAPVPGIDSPLLVLPAGSTLAFPLATQAGPAPAPAPAPCAAGRAAPSPCAPPKPPPPPPPAPKAAPPCPRPRAAPKPKPKPRPPPPPPPPPPCPKPRANPTTPSPCAPAPPPPPPPPKRDDPNLERITSNFQLNFNFNREPANQAAAAEEQADAPQEAEAEAEPADEQEQFTPVPLRPQAARLPPEPPRKPRVYVDAFVLNDGVPQRVDTVDAQRLDPQRAADDDFLAYDERDQRDQRDERDQDADDYEDVQETRDQDNTIREFGNVIDRFWEKKKMMKRTMKVPMNVPLTHYHDVHFGDRDLADELRLRGESHQNLQRAGPRPNRIPAPALDDEDDAEATTTTEDPRSPLKPRVLPPTEHNPNQIDTVTVRVPPIYREKRPRKLHREHHYPEGDEDDAGYGRGSAERDADGYDSRHAPVSARPRRRRRPHARRARAAPPRERDEHTTDDEFDYFGKKVPVTNEEKYFMGLTVPPPTRDADVLRHEKPVSSGYFLEDHERLRDDPSQKLRDDPSHRLRDDPSDRISDERERADSSERSDEKERAQDKERLREDPERAGERDEERSDRLSPNARVTESNYENKFVRATNVQVDDPRPERPERPAPRRRPAGAAKA